MNTIILNFRSTALLIGTALACGSAFSADSKADATPAAQARYQQDKAACLSGKTNQDQQTCIKEAGAAYEQTRRGALNDQGAPYDANARKRCEALPNADRVACLARMNGAGVKTGSEASGGIYRELSVVQPASPTSGAAAGSKNTDQQAPKK